MNLNVFAIVKQRKERKRNEKELERFRKDTSSKLKELKIKLYDYSYFHSTTKIHNQRKVEREQLKNKLNSLINESNSKCGAYLVTGYRGVGKSSIVQELILENSSKKRSPFPLRYIILRILFFTMFFKLFSIGLNKFSIGQESIFLQHNAKLIYLGILIAILLIVLVVSLKLSGFNFLIKKYGNKKGNTFKRIISLKIFDRVFIYIYNKISNRRYLQFICDYIIIFFSILIAFAIPNFILGKNYLYLLALLNSVLPITLILIIFSWRYSRERRIKNFFIKYRKLFININFGHDELDERDIFRLMAYNLRDSFRKRYHSFRLKLSEFLYKLIICLFIFFFLESALSIREKIIDSYNLVNDKNNKFQDDSLLNKLYLGIEAGVRNTNKLINSIFNIDKNDWYIDFILLALCYVFAWFLMRLINKSTYKKILNSLDDLINQIESQVTSSGSSGINQSGFFANFNKQKSYPMASTREIERRLISIFERMRQLPFLYQRFEVVFIFDELDKLEPRSTNGNDNSNGNDKTNHSNLVTGVTPEGVRKRQGNVFKVLANMKYFLTSANAKFIFLAGREMYDAALADVADRNSFLSSIFYDIIYVPSIFNVANDNSKPSNTTDFVEQFVCQQLMPYYDSESKPNLRSYNQFLIEKTENCEKKKKGEEREKKATDKDEKESKELKNFSKSEQEKVSVNKDEGKPTDEEVIAKQKRANVVLTLCNLIKCHRPLNNGEKEVGAGGVKTSTNEDKKESKKGENVSTNEHERDLARKVEEKNIREKIIAKQKREKVIFTLYHFIIYLTHLSNGSTKKMISLFEDFVVMANKDEDTLFADKMIKRGELYLRFDEKDQQLFAMINFLAGPMIQKQNMLGNNIYSDKLLVQTSYITDHILKFHRQPFTDGSLELIPEIVDPNRSPELRALLNDVITGYTKTHLEKVSFNLPNYKFNRLIQHEISYISKLDEQASAAFNFSLDESLASKRHYCQLLESNSSDINSCCAFSYILGELHFFDEQYDEAIQYYSKALARFSDNKFPVDKKDVLFYIKVNLKLGLVFEKRKAYEAAFSHYQTSIDTAICNSYSLKKEIEFCKLSYQAILAKLFLIEKSNSIGVTQVDLDQAEKDFKVIMNRTDEVKTSLFKSDFYYKLATLLYWKIQESNRYETQILEYLALSFNSIAEFKMQFGKEKNFKEPLKVLLNLFRPENIELRGRLNQEKIKQLNKCVTLLANILLSNYEIKGVRIEFIDPESDAYLPKRPKRSENEIQPENANITEIAILLISHASRLAKLNNDDKIYIWQKTKVLYIIKYLISNEKIIEKEEKKKNDKCLEIASYLLKKIIRAAFSMEDNIYKIEIEKLKTFFGEPEKDDYISKKEISLKRATVAFELEEPITVYEDIKMLRTKKVVSQYKYYHTTPYCLGTTSLNQMLWLKSKFHLNFEIFKEYFKNDDNCPLNTSKEDKPNSIDLPKFSYTNFYKWFNYLFSSRSDEDFKRLCNGLGILIDCKGDYKNKIFESILYDSLYCGLEIIRIYKSHGDNKLLSNMFMTKIHEYMILWTSILYFYRDYYKNKKVNYDELIESEKYKRMIYSVACLDYFNIKDNRTNKGIYKTFEIFKDNKKTVEGIDKYEADLLTQLNNMQSVEKYEPDLLKLKDLIGENRMSQLNHVYYAEETRKLYHYTDSKLKELFGYKNEQQNLFYLNDDFTDDRTHFFMATDRLELSDEKIGNINGDKIEDLKYLFFNSQYYEPQRYFETVTD